MNKKKTKKGTHNRETDYNSLNRELGSFGLEPPKRYRPDQQANHYVDERIDGFGPARRQQKKRNKYKNIKSQARTYSANKKPLNKQEQEVYNNKKRKMSALKRKIISIAAIVLLVVIVAVVLSLTVLFKIDKITISGNELYTTKQITAVLPIEKNKNLFLSDTKGAKQKLEENLPYIYNAEIKRKFPTTITVTITETPKKYYIKNPDKTYTILDDNLKVLEEHAAKKPKKSVRIKKAEINTATSGKKVEFKDEQQQADLSELISRIRAMQLNEITAVYSDDINNNYMVYDSRIIFKLGSTDKLDEKIYSALAAADKLNSENSDASGELTVTGDKQVYFTEN